jgi:uroporphyrinogen decarboxylase
VYFANGGSQFLQQQKELHYDSLSLDWRVNLYSAHQIIQNQKVLAGNLDPMVLYCRDEVIEREAKKLLETAESMKFVCNLGHGIEKDMSEHAIGVLVNTVKNWKKEG